MTSTEKPFDATAERASQAGGASALPACTPLEVLEKARALIADKSRWTRATQARTANGEPCSPYSELAYSFCASGAIRHVARDAAQFVGSDARHMLPFELTAINDGYDGHTAVLAEFDRAIALARERGETT